MPVLLRSVLIGSVAVRVVAAIVLVAGPWTDEPAELEGWDAARFQEIADAPGRHWVDAEVEYPPGSVVAIEVIAGDDVVETQRVLVLLSLAIDLGVAALLALVGGSRAAAAYLALGLPLVPMGLVRFDLWSVGLAVAAAVALVRSNGDGRSGRRGPGRRGSQTASFALLATAAALVKVWPGLLVPAAFALGRWRAGLAAIGTMAIAGAGWLLYGGASLDPIDQVVSLRGATGWHVESLGGTLTALLTDAEPERRLDAFRIGELRDGLVLTGRVATIVAVVVLGWLTHRAASRPAPEPTERPAAEPATLHLLALLMLGSTAALLATAPLLSPQFLLWLTPWAALVWIDPGRPPPSVAIAAAAIVLTGAVLAAFGPPGVADPLPAALLLVRNLLLVALVVAVAHELRRWQSPVRPSGTPAAARRPRPTPSSS